MLVIKVMLLGFLGSVSFMVLHAKEEVVKKLPQVSLTVEVTGFKNTKGILCCAVFYDPKAFPSQQDKAVDQKCVESIAAKGPTYCTFDKLIGVGECAVAVFHNEEGKKEIKKNFFGIPVSGLGMSNNVRGRFGPPPFSEAKIKITAESPNLMISIGLMYL